MSGLLYAAVGKLCGNRPKLAEALYEGLVSDPDSPVAAFLPKVIEGLTAHDFAGTHWRSLELSKSRNLNLARYGVVALAFLDYSSHSTLLDATLARYADLMASLPNGIEGALATGYGQLLDVSPESGRALCKLSELHDPTTDYCVSHALFRQAGTHGNEDWFGTSLMNLTSVGADQRGTIEKIDFALSEVSRERPELVCTFLEAWAIQNTDSGDVALPSLFQSAFSSLSNDQYTSLEACITRWFTSEHRALHRAAADFVRSLVLYQDCHPNREIRLSKGVLDSMSVGDVCFTFDKILGYVVDPKALCTLLFSSLQRTPVEELIGASVHRVFVEYLGYNYPGAVGRFLRERAKHGDEAEAAVATRALQDIEEYYAQRGSLPHLKELEPPGTRLREFQKALAKASRSIPASVEHTPLLSLVTRVPLKAGKSWFSDGNGELSQPSHLSVFSHEFELPRGATIDPIGFQYSRLMRRAKARNQRT